MRLGILGPLALCDADSDTIALSDRLRVLLGALAVRANHVVPVDELAEFVWDGAPPARAARTIPVYVARLRKVLGPNASRLVTRRPGYLWQAHPDELDLLQFEYLSQQGVAALRNGRWTRAAELLADAIGLWRGTPLIDIPSETLRRTALPRLDDLLLQAVEGRVDADLRRGRHRELVAELRELTRRHPVREHLHVQLMQALAGSGDRDGALRAYQHIRRKLIDELGIEPGPELRQLYDVVLVDGESTRSGGAAGGTTPGRPGVPRQLPAAVARFTGRGPELAALSAFSATARQRGARAVSAISGAGGVGKTALAVHWAHQVAHRFPDGQLYVNLRGHDADQPMSCADALAQFLHALGVAGPDLPTSVGERAARYRALLADRRMLVVVDNAATCEQVRPLLPRGPGCAALVTSRDRLAELARSEDAQLIDLDGLPQVQSVALLRALIGTRVAEEPTAAAALAAHCFGLPLALRVVAELALSRPDVALIQLVDELADQQRRLDMFDAGGDSRTSVRTVFSWSYRGLPVDAARLFRALSLHPGADSDIGAAAALLDVPPVVAGRLLNQLVSAHLIATVAPGRYHLHDLLRAYAAELWADQHDEHRPMAALSRLLDHYVRTAAAAVDTLFPAESIRRRRLPAPKVTGPHTTEPKAARRWLDAERANLVAVSTYALQHGRLDHAVALSTVLYHYLDAGAYCAEGVTIHGNARDAAQRFGDQSAEAAALTSLGDVHMRQGRYAKASRCHRQAITLFRQCSDQVGLSRAVGGLGLLYLIRGHCNRANGYFLEGLGICRKTGWRGGEANYLNALGECAGKLGRHRGAVVYYAQALALFRQLGDRSGEATVLDGLARTATRQGRYDEAEQHCLRALAIFREIGDRSGETHALNGLGELRLAADHPDEAVVEFGAALRLARTTGDRNQQARAHTGLAEAHHARSGDQARVHWHEALALYSELGVLEADGIRDRLNEAVGPGGSRSAPVLTGR